ncbi:NAD(+) synthetase [candidate division LCP-89 bacterium B3_LCP]|uniref:NH(3)-dependent NAD(+) synthetase n=1 Tax=candidate division LCP-89 bacterium B3_LCP TaxID=2012998 RepID=A0A532V3C6_UNCL8|nr:MAG: NAD(+) synthetase [candidate division LCP-89 bacterium B3_LCP]
MKLLEIDLDFVRQWLTHFIGEYTAEQGFSRVVLGISGGLDSSVCAYLAVEALGKDNCIGVFMPHQVSNPQSLEDAQMIAAELGIRTQLVDITSKAKPFQESFPMMTELQLGNVMARCRMITLYQISAQENALVLGTSNKSEILLGYGTLWGDLACAFDPLGDLYKTQVRALAAKIGIPEKILNKAPSADLWHDQSDEEELGMSYSEADRFLVRWIDRGYSREKLLNEGFSEEFIDRIVARVEGQQFKRTGPIIPGITDSDESGK